MYISDTRVSKCGTCGHKTEALLKDTFICDCCKKNEDGKDNEFLDITVFYDDFGDEEKHTKVMNFCSWHCLTITLANLREDKDKIHFISLPFFTFEKDIPYDRTAEAFFQLLKL